MDGGRRRPVAHARGETPAMPHDRTCPDCGAPLPADAPRGLCPSCLMGADLSRPVGHGRRSRPEVTVALQPTGPAGSGALAALGETLGGIPRVLLRDTDGTGSPDPLVQPGSSEMPGPA